MTHRLTEDVPDDGAMNVLVLGIELLLSDLSGDLPVALPKQVVHGGPHLVRVKHALLERNKATRLESHPNDRARHVVQISLVLGNALLFCEAVPTLRAHGLHSTNGLLDIIVGDQGVGQCIHLIEIHRDTTSLAVPMVGRFYTAVGAGFLMASRLARVRVDSVWGFLIRRSQPGSSLVCIVATNMSDQVRPLTGWWRPLVVQDS